MFALRDELSCRTQTADKAPKPKPPGFAHPDAVLPSVRHSFDIALL